MGKFRNKLIHEYADVNEEQVMAYLKFAIEQFTDFNNQFGRFIRKKDIK